MPAQGNALGAMPYDYLSPERATQKNGHEMNIRTPNFFGPPFQGS